MKNIANVVHDLEAVIVNHHLQIQLLADPGISEGDKKNLLASVLQESNLLKNYIDSLKAEAISNKLEKAKV